MPQKRTHQLIMKGDRFRLHKIWMRRLKSQPPTNKTLRLCEQLGDVMKSTGTCPVTMLDATPRTIWGGKSQENGTQKRVALIPEKIAHFAPNAKIIVIMRDPVARAFSSYLFYDGRAPKSKQEFHQKVVENIRLWENCIRVLPTEICLYDGGRNAVRVGLYALYIEKWLTLFPKEDFLFLRLEDYGHNQIDVLNTKVFPFLGLEVNNNITQQLKNTLHLTRNKSKKKVNSMLAKTRELLTSFYRPYNKRLAMLLKDDDFLWRTGG